MDIRDIYLKSTCFKVAAKDLQAGMLSHAYLIECADQKLCNSFATFLASQIFCMGKDKPCGQCLNCQKIEHGNMVDLKYIPTERGKSIMVEDIKVVVNDAYIRPLENDTKVYILLDFDDATPQAQNKLLKTLEEPPTGVVFILTCRSRFNVLPTICSRVKIISESPVEKAVITEYLKGQGTENYEEVAIISGGKLTTAESICASGNVKGIINLAFETLLNLKSSADILSIASKILALKKDFPLYLETLTLVLRDVSVCGASGKVEFCGYHTQLQALAGVFTPDAVKKIESFICDTQNKLDFNCNMTAVVDSLLLKILEVRFLCQK